MNLFNMSMYPIVTVPMFVMLILTQFYNEKNKILNCALWLDPVPSGNSNNNKQERNMLPRRKRGGRREASQCCAEPGSENVSSTEF